MLSNSPRFKNVRGPLYDPEQGWNPGYRVLASDLLTVIPAKPFSSIHLKRDLTIPYANVRGPETNSIGFLPFGWVQRGVPISVNPIGYELQRAIAIRKIYTRIIEQTRTAGWFSDNDDEDLMRYFKKYTAAWNEWNYATKSHKIEDYPNKQDVVYEDFFGRFLNKLRAGKIDPYK